MSDMSEPAPPSRSMKYPRRMRLSGSAEFLSMRNSGMRINAGPLQFQGRPNDLGHPRLGLSVSRRVGSSVKRNRIKRLLREAFRLSHHDWPAECLGYDLVISVRAHKPLPLAEYCAAFGKAIRSLHDTWRRKAEKSNRRTEPPTLPARDSE
jgi:ribonuclease P protein component